MEGDDWRLGETRLLDVEESKVAEPDKPDNPDAQRPGAAPPKVRRRAERLYIRRNFYLITT